MSENGRIAAAIADWSSQYAWDQARGDWGAAMLCGMVVYELLDHYGDDGLQCWRFRIDGCFDRLPEASRIETLRELRREANRIADEVLGERIG